MSDTIIVTGTVDLDPARRDDAIAAMLEVMEATRAEAGNEAYTFSADLTDPGRLHIVEQWASDEAMQAHLRTPHLAAFMEKMAGVGVKATTLTAWEGAVPRKLM
jgi:quinol monooxygenase YgiN